MSMPLVREFENKDEAAVVELWQRVFPDEPAWNESTALIQQKLKIQRELFLVCEIDEELVGTVVAGFDGVRGWVHKVAAHPDHLRKGIARRLMQSAEEGLSKMGCTKLNLQVRADNDSAVQFYLSAGYAIEPRTSMSKHLHPIK